MFDYTMPSMGAVNRRTAETPSASPPRSPGSEMPVPAASTTPTIGAGLPPVENGPAFPVPPMADAGLPPVENGPAFPVPPMAGVDFPPVESGPAFPVPPMAGVDFPPVESGPAFQAPTMASPVYPVSGYCTIRFLNAAADFEPIRALIGGRVVANDLSYGEIGPYWRVRDGFRTVTITSASSPHPILYRQSVPFGVNEIITLAIVRSSNGLELVCISDIPCRNLPRDRACIRTVNLVHNSPALDVILNDGRVVFSDVRYREVTAYKQARPGAYGFYAAQTPYLISPVYSDIQTLEELPVILANYFLPGFGEVTPLAVSSVDAKAGSMNTIYWMGRWSAGTPDVHARVIRDF